MKTRLLVHADDDPDWAFLMKRALQKMEVEGWNYRHLGNGTEVVEYLERSKEGGEIMPDLLALDIRMPGLDGLEVLAWTTRNVPGLPVVMLSSSELLSDRLEARNLGSKGYFSKASIVGDFTEFLRNWDETAFATATDTLGAMFAGARERKL